MRKHVTQICTAYFRMHTELTASTLLGSRYLERAGCDERRSPRSQSPWKSTPCAREADLGSTRQCRCKPRGTRVCGDGRLYLAVAGSAMTVTLRCRRGSAKTVERPCPCTVFTSIRSLFTAALGGRAGASSGYTCGQKFSTLAAAASEGRRPWPFGGSIVSLRSFV